jgi:hypothetical protein
MSSKNTASQAVFLCLPSNVLNAGVRVPVLGPLTLHSLRNDSRSVTDSLNAMQEDTFNHALSIIKLPNSTSLANTTEIATNYMNQINRVIPMIS